MNPGRLRYEKANSFLCFVRCTGVFFDPAFSHGGDGDNLTWKLYTDGELVIEGAGAMADYSGSSDTPCYSHQSSIKSVTIKSGVTSIGERAFYNCSSLTSILFAGNAPTIGGDCFDAVTGNAYYPKNDATWTAVGEGRGEEYKINGITLLGSDYEPAQGIPIGGFWAQVSVTNLCSSTMDTLILTVYDADGRIQDMYFLCADPQVGQTFTLGVWIDNSDGKIAELRAIIIPMLGGSMPPWPRAWA